jgi:hypothetical protein
MAMIASPSAIPKRRAKYFETLLSIKMTPNRISIKEIRAIRVSLEIDLHQLRKESIKNR